MSRLLIFNPSNDLALATDAKTYYPPRHVSQMESDLQLLPLLWSEEGDVVYPIQNNHVDSVVPWGWSRALRHRLLHEGIPSHLLPTDDELNVWRNLSSREFAAEYMRTFHERHVRSLQIQSAVMMKFSRSVSEFRVQCDEILTAPLQQGQANSNLRSVILKTPWSSSGRGLHVFTGNPEDADVAYAERIINKYGGVLVDRFYDRVLDFAMEFSAEKSGEVRFLGYSLFKTENGRYVGNVIAPEEELRQRINSAMQTNVKNFDVQKFVEAHRELLADMLNGRYHGPVGIDMLIAKEDEQLFVHPCIEINLRMNMGIVALELQRHMDDKAFYERLRFALADEDFAFYDFDCLSSCMRSSIRVPLTPSREHGFQAFLESGMFRISCS